VLLVAAMVVSILLFMGLYVLLLAGALGLLYLSVTLHFDRYGLWTGLFHLGCVAAAGMLVVFLVKALFKRRATGGLHDNPRLAPEAHPELFAFVDRLCAEVGAARPKHICVSADVNAAVFYDNATRSLFWPTRKNLLIGWASSTASTFRNSRRCWPTSLATSRSGACAWAATCTPSAC
jgi:hypothetical protein